MGIFQGHEVYTFVFFASIGAAVEDDMPLCLHQIAYIAFIVQALFCLWVWGIRGRIGWFSRLGRVNDWLLFGAFPLISDSFQLFLFPTFLFPTFLFRFLFLPFFLFSFLFFPQGILGGRDNRGDRWRGGLRRFRFEPVTDEVDQGEGTNDDTGGFYGDGFIVDAKLIPFLLLFDSVLSAFFPEGFRAVDFFSLWGDIEAVPVNIVRADVVEIFLSSVFIRLSCRLMTWGFISC